MAYATVSAEQRLELAMSLVRNADWSRLTPQMVQVVIDAAPKTAGAEFTNFIEHVGQVGDFFRETGEFTIRIPVLPRPTLAELKAKFGWIKSIERDTSPTEAVTLRLGTLLRPGEKRINREEYERRCATLTGLHGYQQAAWLVEHQDEIPELMALPGKIHIDFPGLVVLGVGGGLCSPHLCQDGKRWVLPWPWITYSRDSDARVASK